MNKQVFIFFSLVQHFHSYTKKERLKYFFLDYFCSVTDIQFMVTMTDKLALHVRVINTQPYSCHVFEFYETE